MRTKEGQDYYFVAPDGQTAYFDIDQTIVIWEKDINIVLNGTDEKHCIPVELNGKKFFIRPLWGHVNQIIQQNLKGLICIAWSAGGASWADAVVRALNLQDYVLCSLTKPNFYYDDKPAEHFMGKHYYFVDEELEEKWEKTQVTAPQHIKEEK